jgi:hypothetical protein
LLWVSEYGTMVGLDKFPAQLMVLASGDSAVI